MKLFLILTFLLSVAQEPEEEMTSATFEQAAQQEKREVEKMIEPFRYNRSGLRDPFKLPEGQAPLIPGEVFGPYLRLQEIPLDKVNLKGVFINAKNPKALFQINLGDGKQELIKLGLKDYIGENFGYIAAIRPGKVIIVQTKEQNGEKYSTTRTLSIEK